MDFLNTVVVSEAGVELPFVKLFDFDTCQTLGQHISPGFGTKHETDYHLQLIKIIKKNVSERVERKGVMPEDIVDDIRL